MADGLTLKVDGLREIQSALRDLTNQTGRKVLRAGTTSAARVIVDEAQAQARKNVRGAAGPIIAAAIIMKRVDATQMRDSMIVTVRKKGKSTGSAFFWHFFEFGTKGHTVTAKNAKVLADGKGHFFGYEVDIKPMAAQPFMRPAFEVKWQAAVEACRVTWEARIHRAAKELAR
jgi:HK97 gp10 family phage protein